MQQLIPHHFQGWDLGIYSPLHGPINAAVWFLASEPQPLPLWGRSATLSTPGDSCQVSLKQGAILPLGATRDSVLLVRVLNFYFPPWKPHFCHNMPHVEGRFLEPSRGPESIPIHPRYMELILQRLTCILAYYSHYTWHWELVQSEATSL